MRRPSRRTAAAIAAAGVAILLALSIAPRGGDLSGLFSLPDEGDISIYRGYAERTFEGQVPYRDFVIEYPPGFLPVMLAPGRSDQRYFDRFRMIMLALGAASVVLLSIALFRAGASASEIAAGVLVLATLPQTLTPGLFLSRFDIWPATLVLLALVALLHRHRHFALGALGVGAAAKVYPLAVVPLAILARRGRAHVTRELAIVAAAALALVLPFAILAPRGLAHVAWVLARRPLHLESVGGSVLLVAERLGLYEPTIYFSFGRSWDFAGPAAQTISLLSSLLQAGALVAVWYLFARGPRTTRDLLLAFAAAVTGFVAFGKVFSPQYFVWLAAAVPLALGRARMFVLPSLVVAALLTRYVYLWGYVDLPGRASWVMFARNVLVVSIFVSLLLALVARSRVESRRVRHHTDAS